VAGFASNGGAAAFNAMLAASAGTISAACYCSIRYGRQDVFLVYAGLLGGLVSVTAGAEMLQPAFAALIGAVAGIIVPYFVVKLDMVWKIDDPAGGITIHGISGILSALGVAVLAHGSSEEKSARLVAAAAALGVVALITGVLAGLVFFLLRATLGIRAREADEFDGLDLAEYDLNAYPDFQQTTIKSYHLREM
jgi:Amt family ammonium transporter